MGFSWCLAVAQEVMLFQFEAVDLDERYLLADDAPCSDGNVVNRFFEV